MNTFIDITNNAYFVNHTMKKIYLRLTLSIALIFSIFSLALADTYPKREMRAAWLATVWNLDWPKTDAGKAFYDQSSANCTSQKTYLRNIIQKLKDSGFNAVNFQVRGMCDAMYKSSYEPWSSALTGTRGKTPSLDWDPLEYCIEVCHELGMECHAWVNPFRFCTSSTLYSTTNDLNLRNNGWIITYGSTSVLNPAIEDARNYIVESVCKEIVQNYDIDGMVWDDYFYPNGIPTTNEAEDYEHYQAYKNSGGTMTMANWRRDNVNQTVKQAFNMVHSVKPYVKFGIAPAGVANEGAKAHGITPANITSTGYQYNGIFADPCAWIIDGYIDYISPQLYWVTSHASAPFNPLCEWWNNLASTYGIHCYVSHDIANSTSNWTNSQADYEERYDQVTYNRQTSINYNPGQVYYSAGHVNGPNSTGFGSYLKTNLYQHRAVTPKIVRSNEEAILVNPGIVANFALNGSTLSWTAKTMSILGYNLSNIPMRYAVYAIPLNIGQSDAKSSIHTSDGGFKSDYLLDVTYSNSFDVTSYPSNSYWYAVTIIDRFGYEWEAATIGAPALGNVNLSLNSPANNASNLPFGDNTFSWTSDGTSFTFQISTSEDFTNPLIEEVITTQNITISTANFTDGATYYWRVIASKENYNSAWSETRSFTMETRPFITLTLLTPENTSTIDSETIFFSWEGVEGANYTIEIAEYSSFNNILISETTTATSYNLSTSSLTGGKTYFWRIKATNDGYQSSTSNYASFKTPKNEGEFVDGISINELWIKSLNTDNFPEELSNCANPRSIATYNGNVYILERTSDNTKCSLLEFSGDTGEYLKTINLTGDIYTYSGGNIPNLNHWAQKVGNCIFSDGAGNLYISCITTASELKPLTVCSVNVSTGATTKIFEANLTSSRYRIDYANAFGDLTNSGGQIWAATNTDKVFRWTNNGDGTWTEASTTITNFYPESATSLENASSIQPISSSQFIVDGASTHPTLYTFNSGGNATLENSFANNAAIQPVTAGSNGTYSITIGSTPLFIYVDDNNNGNGHSFSIVANKHDFDFAQFQFMKSVPENKLGSTYNDFYLDQPVAINNADGSATVFLYAPKNGLAAYRIFLPEIDIVLDSPINDAKTDGDFDFAWSGIEGANYILELSTTATFDNIAFSASTTATSYNSSNFNLASETQYYWRVKASCENYTTTTSEVRKFTSPYKESTTGNLSIEKLWDYNISNLPTKLTGDNKRSMTAYNGNVYFTYRASKSELYLLEFNGKTGDFIRQITLTGACVTGEYGANGIFVDGGNNLCVVSMGTSSTIPATVCTVDISTGKTTQMFSYGAANLRFDYVNARGDITKAGGEIWAASSKISTTTNNNRIYRWTRKSDGTWTTASTVVNSFYPTTGETGGTPWVLPISSSQFIVDGSGNYPSLYTFKAGGYATLVDGFNSSSELKPAAIGGVGMHQLEIGKYPLFVYNNETHEGAGFNFNIAYNPSSYNFANLELFWTIPEVNMGKTNHQYGLNSIASIKNEDNSATVYVYAPKNGLAAYRIYLPDMPITLTSPINNIQTEQGFEFSWNGVEGSTYTIELSTSETFDVIAFSATTENSTYQSSNFSLANSTQYYWRVKAANDNYTTTTSAVGQFISPEKPTMTPPQLFKPYNWTTHSSDISFVAKKSYLLVDGVKTYTTKSTLEISKTADFSEIYYSGSSNWKEESSEASGNEIWLQYTLPISYFANGTYFWRVRAESVDPNLEEGISEVRQFKIEGQSEAPGSAEDNYTLKHEDNYEYDLIKSGSNYYTFTNLWIRNDKKNSIGQTSTGLLHRDFCARSAHYGDQDGKDVLWIPGREGNYSATAYLDKYNANTGEYIGRITLTGNYASSIAACNSLFLDGAGRLCMTNLAAANGTLQLATINPTNGAVTIKQTLSVPERIDHTRVIGDIESGEAYIFATSSDATVYRWKLIDGKLSNNTYESRKMTSFYPTTSTKFGTETRIYPIDSEHFYLDGDGTAFTLYNFSSSTAKSTFAAFPSCAPLASNRGNGGTFFSHDGKYFILYSSSAFEKTSDTDFEYKFNLANVSEFTSWGSMNKYWTLPNESIGTVINANGAYGMLADYLQYDAVTGTAKNSNIQTYSSGYDRTNVYIYVPGNGMAAYSLTRHIYTGAEDVIAQNIKIGVNAQEITFGCDVDNAQIYTLSGMLINSIDNAPSINKPISNGVYILQLTVDGTTSNYKIII